MNNGCICCTVRVDLITILTKLWKRSKDGAPKLDHIVIETTGLADPAPVAQTFFVDENIKAFARLDAIVTLVDAKHIEDHLDEVKPEGVENEAVEQIAFADMLLLNKIDLVTEEEHLLKIEKRLRDLNKWAPIHRCENASVGLEKVLNLCGFELERVLEMDPEFLSAGGEHVHDDRVTSVGFNQPGELDMEKTNAWIAKLLTRARTAPEPNPRPFSSGGGRPSSLRLLPPFTLSSSCLLHGRWAARREPFPARRRCRRPRPPSLTPQLRRPPPLNVRACVRVGVQSREMISTA